MIHIADILHINAHAESFCAEHNRARATTEVFLRRAARLLVKRSIIPAYFRAYSGIKRCINVVHLRCEWAIHERFFFFFDICFYNLSRPFNFERFCPSSYAFKAHTVYVKCNVVPAHTAKINQRVFQKQTVNCFVYNVFRAAINSRCRKAEDREPHARAFQMIKEIAEIPVIRPEIFAPRRYNVRFINYKKANLSPSCNGVQRCGDKQFRRNIDD